MKIDLTKNSEVRSIGKNNAAKYGREHMFSVRGADGDVGLFVAETSEEKQKWITELQLCIADIIAPILRHKST